MKSCRLLYVEDNPQDADLTLAYFEEYAPEFEILTVNTGQRCMDRLKEDAFDLLLLDYRLPDMDGLEVMKYLAQTGLPLPVVLLTGGGDAQLVSNVLRLGAVNYVSKNKHGYLETLPGLLTDVLEEHQAKQSLAVAAAMQMILYVEHLTMDIELTLTHFAATAPYFALDVVQTCELALERLSQPHDYKLVLVNDQYGLELMHKANSRQLRIPPFLMISGQNNDTMAIDAMKLGAVDYLCKSPGYLNQLPHRIDHAIAAHGVTLLNIELQAELNVREQTEQTLRLHQTELEIKNEALRQTQIELDALQELYFDLFNNAPTSYFTVTMRGLILQANLAAVELLDMSQHFLVNSRITQFILDQDQGIYYLFTKKLAKSGSSGTCELRMVKQDGTQLWVHLSATLALNENDMPELRLMLKNITERKQIEDELRIAAITFESQAAMIVTDSNAVILRINKAFTKLTGYSEEDVLGQTPHILSSGQHDKLHFQTMWDDLIKSGTWQGEIWNRDKNGDIGVEWLSISSVIKAAGIVSHYVGIYSPIIQNAQAVEEIHRLAYYDPLTKLPNRRLLLDRLSQALVIATRSRIYGSILFLDLDHFKKINDSRGHDAGDRLLIEVAQRLRSVIREGDTLARLGAATNLWWCWKVLIRMQAWRLPWPNRWAKKYLAY